MILVGPDRATSATRRRPEMTMVGMIGQGRRAAGMTERLRAGIEFGMVPSLAEWVELLSSGGPEVRS